MSEHLKCENIVKVGEQELQYSEAVGIVVCGLLSMLLCLTIVVIHFVLKAPWSRRHPGEMVALRCVAEFVFSLIFVILPLSNLQLSDARSDFYHYEPIQNDDKHIYSDDGNFYGFLSWERRPTALLKFFVFLAQWSILASELWFLCIGHDWYNSMTNPFVSYKAQGVTYVLICFGIPFVMGLGTLSPNLSVGVDIFLVPWLSPECAEEMIVRYELNRTGWELKDAKSRGKEGPEGMIKEESIQLDSLVPQFKSNDDAVNEYGIKRQWGNRDNGQDENHELPGKFECTRIFNSYGYIFLFVFLIAIYVYNAAVLIYGRRRLRRGQQNTQKERVESLEKSQLFIVSTFCYWIIPGCLILSETTQDSGWDRNSMNRCFEGDGYTDGFGQGHQRAIAMTYMFALRGFWSSMTIFLAFRKDIFQNYKEQIENIAKENEIFQPHLNIALRTEMLQLSTRCIRYCIQRHEPDLDLDIKEDGVLDEEISSLPPPYAALDSFRQAYEYDLPPEQKEIMQMTPAYLARMESQEVALHKSRVAYRNSQRRYYDIQAEVDPTDIPRLSGTFRESIESSRQSLRSEASATSSPLHSSIGAKDGHSKSISTQIAEASVSRGGEILGEILRRIGIYEGDRVRFYDYNPQAFVEIRKIVGIDPKEYYKSWEKTTKESFSSGAGGAFMFFSKDEKYMAKTLVQSEMETLQRMLMDYRQHIRVNGKSSLLVKIIGLHCMEIYGKKIYFMIQNNIFPPNKSLDVAYDLKGSWVNRQVGAAIDGVTYDSEWGVKEKLHRKKKGPKTLKDIDLNFVFLTSKDVGFELGKQLGRDTKFLEEHNIMDYSLLVGVKFSLFEREIDTASHYSSTDPYARDPETGCVMARVLKGPDEYYFGLIDILQDWNWGKWIEYKTKTILFMKSKRGVSAIKPGRYQRRFMERVVEAKIYGARTDESELMEDVIERKRSSLEWNFPNTMSQSMSSRGSSEISRSIGQSSIEGSSLGTESFRSNSFETRSISTINSKKAIDKRKSVVKKMSSGTGKGGLFQTTEAEFNSFEPVESTAGTLKDNIQNVTQSKELNDMGMV